MLVLIGQQTQKRIQELEITLLMVMILSFFLQNIFLVLNSKKSQWTSMSVFIDFSLNNCNFNLTFRIID